MKRILRALGLVSACAVLWFSAPARAQTSQPGPTAPPVTASSFGGCPSQWVCLGPSVAITAVAINLSTKKVEGAFSPGLGYGFTAHGGQWYAFGADIYGTVDPAAQQVSLTLMGKFLNGYLRVGVSKGFIGDQSWRIPIAFGVDL